MAILYIQPIGQMWITIKRGQTMIGKGQHVRQCGVIQRLGRGQRHRTRHIGNAVMNNTVNHIGRIIMRSWEHALLWRASGAPPCSVFGYTRMHDT